MRDLPSPELRELLDRLGLAPRLRWRSVAAVARRIAGSLPPFDSIWLDALVRMRLLTPYQSREIGAGRGSRLIVGPHVIRKRAMTLGYAEVVETTEQTVVIAALEPACQQQIADTLSQLTERLKTGTAAAVIRFDATGTTDDSAWVSMQPPRGVQAADWMVENGRFPPRVVMHIARQMLIGLSELERQGLAHGDLRAHCLFLERSGQARLAFAGLRDVLLAGRPDSAPKLPPECFDSLSPERVRSIPNRSDDIASDLFACGCLWWQLLTGRPPIPGGNSATKHANARVGKVADVRKFAPDVPEVLADLIAKCTQPNPADRPRSFAEMAAILGPPSEAGAKLVARCLRRPERWVLPRPKSRFQRGKVAQLALEVVAVSACLLVALFGWRLLGRFGDGVVAQSPKTPVTVAAPVVVTSAKDEPDKMPAPQASLAKPVSFHAPLNASRNSREPEPLRLPERRLLRLTALHLEDGQRVCGERDGRVRVQTPPEGLLIDRADTRFEKIDFVAYPDTDAAMLRLTAATASFVDCTFRGPENAEIAQPAIRWETAAQSDQWDPASDLLELTNCGFDRCAFAVERERESAASLEAHNVLQTRSAGFLRVIATGKSSALRMTLENCTFRETGPVVRHEQADSQAEQQGRLIVSAVDSVFAIQPGCALVEWQPELPADVADRIKWSGRDSLLSLEAPLVAVANAGDDAEADSIDEQQLNIVGLGRSTLTFTADSFETPAASVLKRWVAARKSLHPPGIIAKRLPPRLNAE